jgi:hypothetical protein
MLLDEKRGESSQGCIAVGRLLLVHQIHPWGGSRGAIGSLLLLFLLFFLFLL